MGRLAGKSVVITGAGSGIGRAASLMFAKEGARIIATDINDSVLETAEHTREAGCIGEAVVADAGSEADVMSLIAQGRHNLWQARRHLGQCGHQRRAVAALRADTRTLAGSFANQPDRSFLGDQAFNPVNDQTGVRFDRLHSFGSRFEVRSQRSSLCFEQSRGH